MDRNFYTKDIYLKRNPTLHAEDSYWKFTKIIPLIDKMLNEPYFKKLRTITILDIGGGGGIIINRMTKYIESRFNLKVSKFIADLSPAMLKTQRDNNPDLKGGINCDITQLPIFSKTIDIVFLIDVLEHVPDYEKALNEIRRISHYSVFKVPLENNMYMNVLNQLTNNSQRQNSIETVGHLHFFNYFKLRKEINTHCGTICELLFTNNIQYLLSKKSTKESMGRIERKVKRIALLIFKISPLLCSLIFNDFAVFSVDCYD